MTLSAGTRLGAYEIVSPLGVGGMGEVYRARDSKLGREVAVKVLPESLSADPERLMRFEREARALAALNHPNIVTVYAVEDVGGVRLLAMELVEGHTLDGVIQAGGLPLSRFFEIAMPFADALSAAHERGIVHRDLKPSNVMLTREGRLKVLDFGLAKLAAASSDPNVADRPTESHVLLTDEGTVFGTVAYMSPEQARGGKVDARSDVFSLGVVFYEMLTGDRPFKGTSAVDIISAILRDWPPPVNEVRVDLPPHVGRILRRCLAKDPHDRYQTSRDVFNELRDLQVETSSAPRVGATAPAATPAGARSARSEGGFCVAVLPLKSSGDAETDALAHGLGEEITTGLSRFRYLSVVASASAADARWVLEGSIRKGGSAVRIGAQLVDAQTGARLWAETYNRDLQASSVFSVQDDVAARIVATVADSYGVLVHAIRAAIQRKDDAELTPVEWQFQYFAYREQITPAAHAELASRLERAIERDEKRSELWACLAQIFVDAYAFGFGNDATSLDRALSAARRAVELDRANQFALVALAQVHFFRRDLAAFGPAAERAMALNPQNSDAVGILGLQIVHTGQFERGTAIVRRAMEINPNHAGWMHFAPLWDHFHRGEYAEALECANRVDVPGLFWPYLVMAAAGGHLGRQVEAEAAVRDLLALDPEFAAHARANIQSWHFASGLLEPLLEGLRKAGLVIPVASGSSDPPRRSEPARDSGPVRADEGFWVAVLPFRYGGGNPEVRSLAEGLTEDTVAGLSRFSYLKVIARQSTAKYASESGDVRAIGKELGARYVMEGSLRQAGTKLRLAVQLVEATAGSHLWAETYERAFTPESVFELQDDLVPRIVSTVADVNGVLTRSINDILSGKSEEALTPQEALLRSFRYYARSTPEEHATVRRILERAVKQAPDHADCWASLANMYNVEFGDDFNPGPDPLDRALAAAQRAVDLAPTHALGFYALAFARFFRKETAAFRAAAERAVALNPMDGETIGHLGVLMDYVGELEEGRRLVERAKRLNPNMAGLFLFQEFTSAYRQKNYAEALAATVRMNMPGFFHVFSERAAALGQLGQREEARRTVQELLALKPDFAEVARREYTKWYDAGFVEHMLDGLRKAGLDVPPGPSRESAKSAVRDAVAIAVLPFSDLSPARDQEYLCEGMAEEIMNALVRIDGIRVASRTSAFRARQGASDLPSIAKALSVGHVLEGSIRTSGSRLRVTAQLTDVTSGFQSWSERYDRETTDIFAVQDEIAAGVVDAVKARLAPGTHAVPSRPHVHDLEAYRSYLQGRHLRGKEHLVGALRAFEEAVRLDPSHAPSWTGLAEINVLGAQFGLVPAREACATARKALSIADELQGESADGRHVEGFVAFIERRWEAMETAWRRALELQPAHVLALGSFGIVLCTRGRLDEALPLFARARDADPLASFPYMITGGGLLSAGKPQEALRYFDDALSFEKEDVSALFQAGTARVALEKLDEGIADAERAVLLSHRAPYFVGILGWALATAGRKDDARKLLEELRARPAGAPAMVPEAWLLGALGEVDLAFELLARAEEENQATLYYTGWPGFDPLRDDPRFAALLARLGLPSG